MFETAERRTGLRDWGNDRFKEALAALLDSVNHEGRLTFFGRFAFRQFLIQNLCSRLRILEVLKRFPEIRQQNIQKPVFVTGWYRTGTTYLHNLLASHPEVRVPFYWELRHPCPGLDPRTVNARRQIRRVKMESRIHAWLAPGFSTIHPMQAEKPEECLHLFDKACTGTAAFFITEAKSFGWWLLDHDIQHGYDFFKHQLQLLNWLRPGRQWVLKWPHHFWHLDALLRTFPDATIIQMHRDPREAIPSVCSLAAAARAPFCDGIDAQALGRFWLDYGETGLERSLSVRKKTRTVQIIDIRYPDLKKKPREVINQIQKTINLGDSETWTKNTDTRLNAEDNENRTQHRYDSIQFGLDPDYIRERFSSYIQDYDLSA